MAEYLLRLELDVDTRSVERFVDVSMAWLDEGSRRLEPELRRKLDAGPAAPIPDIDDPDEPWGSPGAVFGTLTVSRTGGTRLSHTRRPSSAQGWEWLRRHLARPPFAATATLRRLGQDGLPERWCDLQITTDETAPGWVRLIKDLPSSLLASDRFGSAQQAQWVSFLRTYADRVNPAYGQIGVTHNGGETTLETCLPLDGGRNRPWNTIVESRRHLRGYGWLTVVAEQLIEPLGGIDRLTTCGVFAEVAPLRAGGVWLRATDDFRDYDLPKAEQLFDVLAPVLRPGKPQPPDPDPGTGRPRDDAPYLLAFEDAGPRHRPVPA